MAEAGADALGLVFYGASPRAVRLEQAIEIAAAAAPFLSLVGLFVNEPEQEIARILSRVPLDMLQFHGDEPPSFCAGFQRPYIKGLRVRPDMDLARQAADYSQARALLLDNWQEGVPGGTGQPFDWQLAQVALPRPMILAGGLNPDNVATAISQLAPAAVDVSGGVESAPGIKDPDRVRDFVSAVRAADHDN